MHKFKLSDFTHNKTTNKWLFCFAKDTGEIIDLYFRVKPTEEVLSMLSFLLDRLEDQKEQLISSSNQKFRRELRDAFSAAVLSESTKNIQVWSATVSLDHQKYTGSIFASIADKPIDPRKKSDWSPILLICVEFSDGPENLVVIDLERLVDMED